MWWRATNKAFHRACHHLAHNDNRISSTLDKWKRRFIKNSIPEPRVSAEYIVAHVIGKKTLYNTDLESCLTEEQVTKINTLCNQRLDRTPVQYVIGEWDFHELTLAMRPPVLIPRPETEELADFCSSTLRQMCRLPGESQTSLLEIGSGSGALTVLLLKRFRQLQAVSVDISSTACHLTRHNADIHGVGSRLTVVHGDFTHTHIQSRLSSLGPYSCVVSNPPYVTTQEMESLQPEIYKFEDSRALHGGLDGFDLIKEILLKAPSLLKNNGHVWLETGTQHPGQVARFVATQTEGLDYINTETDFCGRDRFCHLMNRKSTHKDGT